MSSESTDPSMLHLNTRLYLGLQRAFGLVRKKTVSLTVLGKTYTVVEGTLRKKADYDDAWLLALAHEAQSVYDVGCNIGQSSLLLLWPINVQDLILIEPNPLALSICAENLILNGLSQKARFVCAFASERAGDTVEFFTVGVGAAGSMFAGHARTARHLNQRLRVCTVSLDSIYTSYGLLPDLVKIDVEGAESRVLRGAQEIARHQRTRFFVEMHSPPELPMEQNAGRIIAWCSTNQYTPWYLKEKVILREASQIAQRGRCHLLLLPSGSRFPEYLHSLEQGASLEQARAAIEGRGD